MEVYTRLRKGFGGKRLLESCFFSIHPIVIFTYYCGLFLLLGIFNHPLFLVSMFVALIYLGMLYAGGNSLRKWMKAFLFIPIFIVIINPLTSHRGTHILGYFLDNPITLEAMVYGVINGILIMSLALIFVSFNVLIDSQRFLYLFARFVPKVAFITNMTIRFQEIFLVRGKEIIQVSKVNQDEQEERGWMDKIKAMGRKFELLTTWSLEEGMLIAGGIKVKEYGKIGRSKRTNYCHYKWIIADTKGLVFLGLLLLLCLIFSSKGGGNYDVYRGFEQIGLNKLDVGAFVVLLIYLNYPMYLELRGMIMRYKA